MHVAKTQVGVAVSLLSSYSDVRADLKMRALLIVPEWTGRGRVLDGLPAGKTRRRRRSLVFSIWWNPWKRVPWLRLALLCLQVVFLLLISLATILISSHEDELWINQVLVSEELKGQYWSLLTLDRKEISSMDGWMDEKISSQIQF